ncbi:hypothetical protein DCC85_02075 [Paenibacillus sp. CAA11]|uniref:hypothetical protein n=1 Tax=Paenibacillus sp. CAA11 TaxID=1532905 RepID=UPI000D35F722|nr:hypothetical protein [Paenibacillus sp. CAA11]AWB43137.1 hypothetical protein DCC85_02075 [Paenibacillus sp. CAA11]
MLKRLKIKLTSREFWKDERGEMGIRGIAITVGVIVFIGIVLAFLRTNAGNFIQDAWDMMLEKINSITG